MLCQPIYDQTSPDGLLFFTGNPNQYFSNNLILQEACKRIDLMTTYYPQVHAIRFFVQFPYGYGARDCDQKISQFFKVLKHPAQMDERILHYVWVKENSITGRPTYHVLALINSPYPGSDDEFADEVNSCWSFVLGDYTAEPASWYYLDAEGRGARNFISLEHPASNATGTERISQDSIFRNRFMCCLEWARDLARICSQEPWQRDISFGVSEMH